MSERDRHLPRFDPEVERAMAKWPNVPRCFGWLELDRRGAWRIRGERIGHPRAVAFLGRHYRSDEAGRWYVQNGPQQVFVELAYTPWVYRYDPHTGFTTHTGVDAGELAGVYVDDEGNVLIEGAPGIGVLDDRDLATAAALFETDADDAPQTLVWRGRRLPCRPLARAEVPVRFGFDPAPAEPPNES